jgi:hypothetical protein
MAPTVSLSTRISPQIRDRLAGEAAARGVPLGTYTRSLLEDAQPRAAPDDGDVVRGVDRLYGQFGPDAAIERAIAMAVARVVEAGGSPAVTAAKELVVMCRMAENRFGSWDDEDEDDPELLGRVSNGC